VPVEGIIVVLITCGALAALALSRVSPDAVFAGALTLVVVAPVPGPEGFRLGVIPPSEAFAGFSNPGLLTVGVLYVVVMGLRQTGAIDWLAQGVLGQPRGLRPALFRLLPPVVGASAFLNNTPLVAMMIPAVSDWSKRLRLAPSKLMIPLSYAAILGGFCSLIGTSTNLVVAGLAEAEGTIPPIGMFDITRVGLPCAAAGVVLLMALAPRLLPDRESAAERLKDPREYTMEMIVPQASALAGKSIEAAGLRRLPGAFLASIERQGQSLPAVPPDFVLRADDRLIFVGDVGSMKDLQKQRGLTPATNQVFKLNSPRYRRQLFEAVVSNTCPLIGRTIREGRFRNRYHGVVLAVARNGERLLGKVGDVRLKPGDTLLIEAGESFVAERMGSRDFFLVSRIEDSVPRRHERAPVSIAILAGMVLMASMGWTSMLGAGALAAALMVLTRCCSMEDARSSIDWPVLIVIGSALGLGAALDSSGAAGAIAGAALAAVGDHPWAALAAIYVVTSVMTEALTNNAAVALIFPVALATANRLEADAFPFVIAIMMAGSASFATPIGYQTNLMVYGPGGYRFRDFVRIGLPMNVAIGVSAVTLIPFVWPF